MHQWDDIWGMMTLRRSHDSAIIRQMISVRDHYNGDVIIPLPDIDGEPQYASVSPQIVADGIDHTAMRAASVMPQISVPAMSSQPRARDNASKKRRALYASWHYSALELLLYRSFRHFIGYGTGSLIAVPDFESERACIELRDPLSSYPELRTPEDFHEPLNVGFVYGRSADWILSRYPHAADLVTKWQQDTLWDIVEWIDEDHVVMGILGPRNDRTYDDRYYPRGSSDKHMELRRWPNRAGMVPATVPRRATLDRIMGQLTHVLPSVDLLDRFTLLEIAAAEKHVFPDMVILGKRTAVPTLSGGRWKDGRTGEPNIVLDADGVQLLQSSVGPATFPTMERLEKAARGSGGVLPQFTGETGGSLRTGRALDALGGFSVDPRVMEAQKFMGRALETINQGIMAVEKGYWPSKKFTVYSGWSGDTEVVEYVPERVFDNLHNSVDYSMPGLDISQVTVALGQLVGAKLMSRDTARTKHPMIPDGGLEEKAIVQENIEDAVLVSFLQQASTGTLPLIDLVRINEVFQETGSMIEAVKKADAEARARQAAEPPAPQPGQVAAPEAQPGLAQPGQGAETGSGGPAAGPGTGPERLQQVLAALQGPPQSTQTIINR